MNHIHRVIFTASLGIRQAVPETARALGSSARRGTAVAAAILYFCATVTWAAGGTGGAGGSATDIASPGGVGATTGDGGAGADGSLASGQGGGGGGGGAASRTGIAGGAGGVGGAGSSNIEPITGLPFIGFGTNGGRAGNAGAMMGGDIAADTIGGVGESAFRASIQSYDVAGGGGGGGEGGVGLIVPAATAAHVLGGVQVFGGAGGSGGVGGYITAAGIGTAGSGGAGGDGGIGVYMSNGATLVNDGVISGGRGGFEGEAGSPVLEKVTPTSGRNGSGGIGVVANGGFIDNGGSISGGFMFNGPTSPAVFFNSGDTTLRLRAGTVIDGALSVGPNASATILAATNGLRLDGGLILGGPATVNTDGFSLEVNSTISGPASLTKSGAGTLLLSANNTYTGATTVAGGTLQAGAGNAFGSTALMTVGAGATLDLNGYSQSVASLSGAGVVSFGAPNGQTPAAGPDFSVGGNGANSTFNGQVVGNGNFTKVGPGTLEVGGSWRHGGSTSVSGGTLRATAAGVFSPAATHVVATGATLDTGGFDQTVAGLTNSGTVSLLGGRAGSTLTVTGPYVGNGGLLRMGAVLGDSSSASDRLVLDGPNATATGTTNIQITSLSGLGAQTVGNGIEVVRALNGATTTAQTTKSAFVLNGGHVDAGAFEYRLYPADANGSGESWYLRSAVLGNNPTPSGDSPTNGGIANGADAGLGLFFSLNGGTGIGTALGAGAGGVPTYRVEVPLLAALPEQLRQANVSMLSSLHRRVGDDRADPPTDAESHGRRVWGRLIGECRRRSYRRKQHRYRWRCPGDW